MILQDADEAGDSIPASRTCTPQNWRVDVAVAAKVGVRAGFDGAFVCRGDKVDEAYGKAISYPLNSADLSADDGVDDLDNTAFYAAFSNGDPEAELNLDDAIDDLDITAWKALFQSGVTKEYGSGALSGLLVGYAGYMRDGFDDDLYHVRHRVYDTELGRWTRRDPLGYVDGMSVYEYVQGASLNNRDSFGLCGNPPKQTLEAAVMKYNALVASGTSEIEAARALAALFGACVAALVTGFDAAVLAPQPIPLLPPSPIPVPKPIPPSQPAPASPAQPAPLPAPISPPTDCPKPIPLNPPVPFPIPHSEPPRLPDDGCFIFCSQVLKNDIVQCNIDLIARQFVC